MKKKTLIIVIAVVAVMAIFSAVAFAWWTTEASIAGNEIVTGEMGLAAGGEVPISAHGLIPQLAPPAGPNGATAGYSVKFFYITNTKDVPIMAYGYIDNLVDNAGIAGGVNVKITIAPTDSIWVDPAGTLSANPAHGPYLVYEGPLNGIVGEVAGKANLSTRYSTGPSTWGYTPLAAGQQAWYKVVTWLDADAGNSYQGKWLTCDLKFKGMQESQWVD